MRKINLLQRGIHIGIGLKRQSKEKAGDFGLPQIPNIKWKFFTRCKLLFFLNVCNMGMKGGGVDPWGQNKSSKVRLNAQCLGILRMRRHCQPTLLSWCTVCSQSPRLKRKWKSTSCVFHGGFTEMTVAATKTALQVVLNDCKYPQRWWVESQVDILLLL